MRIHSCGVEDKPVIIMLPGSFCNADTMANIITRLKPEFHILAVDYSGQYAGSETPFTSRAARRRRLSAIYGNKLFALSPWYMVNPWAVKWGWNCFPG